MRLGANLLGIIKKQLNKEARVFYSESKKTLAKLLQEYKSSTKQRKVRTRETKVLKNTIKKLKKMIDRISNINDDLRFNQQVKPGNRGIVDLSRLTVTQAKRINEPTKRLDHTRGIHLKNKSPRLSR